MERLLSEIEAFRSRVFESGYRGLVVLLGPVSRVAEALARLRGRRRLVVCKHKPLAQFLAHEGFEVVSPSSIVERLGSEYEVVVVDTYEGLEADHVAAAAEMVVGGGVFVLVGKGPWSSWRPGLRGALFAEYLKSRILKAGSVLVADLEEGRLLINRPPDSKCPPRSRPEVRELPRWLAKLVATRDQARAVEEAITTVEERRAATLLVLGDRGRGKSYAIGLALAALIASKRVGEVSVVAPSLYSVQSLFAALARGLREAGVPFKAWGEGGLYEGVKGSWFKVYYASPHETHLSALTVVDEAAALGVARLRRIVHRARKVLAASTVHGYEGSGRTLTRRLLSQLPNPRIVELKEPIRYPPGDPLERWLYDTFMLDAEPFKGEVPLRECRVEEVPKGRLVSEPELLRSLYSILVQAHYRNRPSDLQLMLEEDHALYAVTCSRAPVSVAQISYSDRMLSDVLERSHGVRLRASRVVRIATIPSLQRRGLGSMLLRAVEEDAKRRGFEVVGAVFSNHEVVEFWIKNGYSVIYVSPRFNKVTGEKNIAVVKPLSPQAEEVAAKASADFLYRLVLSGASVYRDLAAETVAAIMLSCRKPWSPPVLLTSSQLARLKQFLGGEPPEKAMDALLLTAALATPRCAMKSLEPREVLAVAAFVVQGKPIWEASKVVGVEPRELEELLRRAYSKLVTSLGYPAA